MDVFHPDRMADRILGMGDIVSLVEKAQEKMDMEAAQKSAEKMLSGKFDLNDMLAQFEQIERMGPLSGIMKMLPGMNQYAGMMDENATQGAMKHSKAIIQSMTKWERENPEKIRSTMKKRIARGSGTSVNEVNKLLNQHSKMKKMMGTLGGMARSGNLNEEKLNGMMDKMQNIDPSQLAKMKNRFGRFGR